MSTTRQRLVTNMGPLFVFLAVVVIIGAHLACWYGLFVSAKHDDTGWAIFWATTILSTASLSRSKS